MYNNQNQHYNNLSCVLTHSGLCEAVNTIPIVPGKEKITNASIIVISSSLLFYSDS